VKLLLSVPVEKMTTSYTVNGTSDGISIEGSIKDALSNLRPSDATHQLVTLKFTEIKILKGGIANIEKTEIKAEITTA
jgi:hypothetical protein